MGDEGKIDLSSPYYLGAGDQPGNLITHVILKGDNYLAWSRAITLSLRSRRKFGFVDGTISKPTEKKKMLDWVTVNSILVSWLLRSMEPKVAASLPYFDEAKRLWDYLEKRFCVSNGPRLQQLRSKIATCKQTTGMSVSDYYNTLLGLFDDLTRLKPPHGCECGLCTCDVAGKYAIDKEEEFLHQFLIGIDDNLYSGVRSNLLSQQPPVDINRALQALLQEEESRGVVRGKIEQEQPKDAHVFAMPSDRGKAPVFRRDKSKLTCSHCRKSGHEQSTCFELHGHPQWWLDKYGAAAAAPTARSGSAGATGSGSAAAASERSPGTPAPAIAANSRTRMGTGVSSTSSEQAPHNLSIADLKPEDIRVLLNMVNHRQQDRLQGPTFGEPDWSG